MPRIGPKKEFESLEHWCMENDAELWLKLWDEQNKYAPDELDKGSAEEVKLRALFYKDGSIIWDPENDPRAKDIENITVGPWLTRPTEIARDFHKGFPAIPYLSPKKQWGLHGLNSISTKYPEMTDEWDEEKNARLCRAPNGQPANVFNVPYDCKTEYYWMRYYEVDGQVAKVEWTQSPASRVKEIERGHEMMVAKTEKEQGSQSEHIQDAFDMDDVCQIIYQQPRQYDAKRCHNSAPKILVDKKDEHFIPLTKGLNDLVSSHPTMAYEIDYEKNREEGIDTNKIHKDMKEEIWWRGPNGQSWKASPAKRLAGRATPPFQKPHTSFPEQAIFFYIKQAFQDAVNGDRKQLGGRKELDIFIQSLKLGIEYDGERWHTDLQKDMKKNELCEANGIRLIRIREANCPDLPESVGMETITLEDHSTKELTRAINTILDWLLIKNINVDINADKSAIKAQYMPEVNKNYLDGHLLLPGREIRKRIDPQEAALIKHVKFANVDKIPPDEKVYGGAKYKLSEDDACVKCSDGVYRDKICGWREGDTFYITTGDDSKIYVDENCYETLLAFPNLKSVELQNVAEKTGNDIRQLLYGVRNRPKVKIKGYDVQQLDLYGKKIDFVGQEEYDGHNVFSVKDGYISRTIEQTKTPLERMLVREAQYVLGEYSQTEQLRVAGNRDYLKSKTKSKGPKVVKAERNGRSQKKKGTDLER